MTIPKILAAAGALVVLVAGAVTVRDEVKLEGIRIGMSAREVEARLGKATEELRAPLPAYALGLNCRDASLSQCHVYHRRLRTSLFVYYDQSEHVACVEHAMLFIGGIWKTADRQNCSSAYRSPA